MLDIAQVLRLLVYDALLQLQRDLADLVGYADEKSIRIATAFPKSGRRQPLSTVNRRRAGQALGFLTTM